ncbi:unnamed protein product [Nippostrongylus brasiliensis]|uniref:Similar to n=1 Tax=Nippostrongylus brasiliensis TaxID=27835 RepID=A0A0N4Y770_NIPBR|nr:unnamed protein product [Nippostrongylus brasiliensis]
MYNADNGHGHSPSGSAPTDRPPRAESNLPPQQEREQMEHVPGTSRRDALPSMSDLPDPQQPDEQDDWRDLLSMEVPIQPMQMPFLSYSDAMEWHRFEEAKFRGPTFDQLTPDRKSYFMLPADMRLFIARCPLGPMRKYLFNPFMTTIKNFLVSKLFDFNDNKPLYTHPPVSPPESSLPPIIKALGPPEVLDRDFPALARIKREMIANILHFMVTYCLDWLCEIVTIKCDRDGRVNYSYPIMDIRREDRCPRLDQGDYSDKSLASDESDHEQKGSRDYVRPSLGKDTPGTSHTGIPNKIAPANMSDLPDPRQPPENDMWSGMLEMAVNDPDLPVQYKTMIQCLVANNRDLRRVAASMQAQR